MRRTPPVAVHLQAQPVVQAHVALIAALAAGGLAASAISHQPLAWPVMLGVPLAAVWTWRTAAVLPRRLRWDGQTWWLAEPGRADETEVQLAVLLDFDNWLLLRASPGPRWLPLSRRQQQAQWTALRATLFSAPQAP
ncbi:MAG: hypothetical protein ACT6S0_00735 [Roseateles sp.]|uniref:hypothetical protein n=1 Tax=Roseateles sp. TaxID=1971397 RepID=UPI004035EA13